MKTCSWCGESKDETEFSLHSQKNPDKGLKAHCKECHRKDSTRRHHKNPHKYNTLNPTVDEKRCCRCKQVKHKSCFYHDPRRKDGLHPECKECKSASWYRLQYGLDYDTAKAILDGGCQACGAREGVARLVIDHCHTTGKVRGCLCSNCNTALGSLGDNLLTVLNLANYLAKSLD